jgi:hypothetical protein
MALQTRGPEVAMRDAVASNIGGLQGRDALRTRIIERELKKAGYKAKIRAFCCHCIFDPYQEGTWLKQVENCTSFDCPIYSVRPMPVGKTHGETKTQLRAKAKEEYQDKVNA